MKYLGYLIFSSFYLKITPFFYEMQSSLKEQSYELNPNIWNIYIEVECCSWEYF